MSLNSHQNGKRVTEQSSRHKFTLMSYDLILLALTDVLMLIFYPSEDFRILPAGIALQIVLGIVLIFACRIIGGVYKQIWRYGGTLAYLKLVITDAAAEVLYVAAQNMLPKYMRITFIRTLCIVCINLLATIAVRLVYQYLYEYNSSSSRVGHFLRQITSSLTGIEIKPYTPNSVMANHGDTAAKSSKINIAIVGAGRVGVALADELLNNPRSAYSPCCFIDIDREKIGRNINGIRVLAEQEVSQQVLESYPIQEIVFALPEMNAEYKKILYERYKETGCKIKVYDYPLTQTAEADKRHLREFDIEELLFRNPLNIADEKTSAYYRDKVILITGGGGSIGGELCRQIAKMHPKHLIVMDVYENCAYDLQQELKIAYGPRLKLDVEILSMTDRPALEKIFAKYRPDIVIHAAAHKHVPLMEHNCVEAVRNNVFGTLNVVNVSEQFGVSKFIMVSTDKAVNPTNVMGATKRMCEMIVQSRVGSGTNFSATRFGNVLGSNGSVIPLFRRQIANGGPVTLTDKRIIRYFMTIPEASQLVLRSGAMARSGELYVLDMGKPVKILELAESMIRLAGYEPYKDITIVETGLRPGEKLYEELLVKNEDVERTDSDMIFIERDKPLSREAIEEKLEILREALKSEDNDVVREALRKAVPTFHSPEEVNAAAEQDEKLNRM